MTSRIGQPDTEADRELRRCLDQQPVRSFLMTAGAGSGKTTSLVKALAYLAHTKGTELRRRGQQIACITYTDVAVGEILGDVGDISLFHVSTIHSFLWTIVNPFQVDIRQWVKSRIQEKIIETEEKIAKPKTQVRTRQTLTEKIVRYRHQSTLIDQVPHFTYGTGSDYSNGVLGHDDILKLGPELIRTRPLLCSLIASKFPFIFVDESQDTVPTVIDALRHIEANIPIDFCLGFFGDPMQKIYATGAGMITPSEDWNSITKPENFRCPARVLNVVNRIRADDDGLQQVPGRNIEYEGTARIFVLPADEQRTARLQQVRNLLAEQNNDPLWQSDEDGADVRILVLVHRMAATRLGFANIYAALNDDAPPSLKEGLTDGSAWVLRPFLRYILPLVVAYKANADFDVISELRTNCPLLSAERLSNDNTAALLNKLKLAVLNLTAMLEAGSNSTIKDVLELIREEELCILNDRFIPYLAGNGSEENDDDEDSEKASAMAFLACPAVELWGYRTYIEDESPFATQQGVKGAEFQRVLAVLDDEESNYSLFSYGKYFGITPLSAKDAENIAAGNDSVLGRTRRLFYVCCSRATKDLAIVLFVPDVTVAKTAIIEKNIFPQADVYDTTALSA